MSGPRPEDGILDIGDTVYFSTDTVSFNALHQVEYVLEADVEARKTRVSFYDGSKNIGNCEHPILYLGTRHMHLGSVNPESTICLPFSIPGGQVAGYSPIAGATVMKLESSTFSESTRNLTMYFKNATSIEAGKPYIVRWDKAIAENIKDPVFLNATVSTTLYPTETDWVNFIGSTSQVSIAGEDRTLLYLGANNKLVYPSGAMTFGACRAYFQLKGLEVKPSDPTETGINIVMDFDGTETAIQTVESDIRDRKDNTAQVWYSLDGRRLVGKPSAKGVYIHSGRKVVIR